MGARRTYGWSPARLSDAYTTAELTAWLQELSSDPANANPDHAAGRSVYLHSQAARRKMDALSWAITHRMKADREAAA
ncbi:hypothetical protein [Brevundimonas sp. FT23028]|uniref:hypothetical protein n=1 Tax=Brevundimonas sp. FT23028 TaxID=3393748 RepID=UPI003B58A30D